MLLRLIAIDVVGASLVVAFYTALFTFDLPESIGGTQLFFNIPTYLFLVFVKIMVTVYVVLEWLNEYYELSVKEIYHRSGVVFKKEEKFPISNIGRVDLSQSIFGKLLNYGSISAYDHRNRKHMDLYLIHNPLRYYRILEDLVPDLEEKREIIRSHLYEEGDEDEEHLVFRQK